VTQDKGLFRRKGKYEFGGPLVEVSTSGRNDVVKSVAVEDADGKPVGVVRSTYPSRVLFGQNSSFVLEKPLKQGKLTVTYFSKTEEVTVPVDLSVSLGE